MGENNFAIIRVQIGLIFLSCLFDRAWNLLFSVECLFGFFQLFDDDAWRNAAVTWLTVYVGAAFFSRASIFATSKIPEIVSSVCAGILLLSCHCLSIVLLLLHLILGLFAILLFTQDSNPQ